MEKKQKIILLSSVIAIVAIAASAIAYVVFSRTDSKVLERSGALGLLNKDYKIEKFSSSDEETDIRFVGDFSKEDSIAIGKIISQETDSKKIKLIFSASEKIKIEDGFYAEGLTSEIEINNINKKLMYAEFINEEIKLDAEIGMGDLTYNSVKKDKDIAYLDVSSKEIDSTNYKEQLFQFARIINNSNKDLKNVIVLAKVDNLTYGLALSNPKVIKVIEEIKI